MATDNYNRPISDTADSFLDNAPTAPKDEMIDTSKDYHAAQVAYHKAKAATHYKQSGLHDAMASAHKEQAVHHESMVHHHSSMTSKLT